ncbi:ThuA domain-containing protein [Steroidobacter flavus]|uniref:ThuA domain-containing protein n=1 Tax=Steroidobacter flavus TaxID=1842136 RepID=A0ABV8SWR6_9GAMM
MKRILGWSAVVLLALLAIFVVRNYQRVALGGVKVYETTPPRLPDRIQRPAILVFSKTNGFRHEEAIPAANALFAKFATDQGWGYFQTENGAVFNRDDLSRFDAVVFNNVSGDVFTAEQRAAFEQFLRVGAGFVGVHGSGGDMTYNWRWYVEDVIGAQFKGHPMFPQFQPAKVRIEDRSHAATREMPAEWLRTDEWYSFEKSPRGTSYNILATLDEKSYAPKGLFGKDLSMGEDHPIIWWHCVGRGRVFYSALGHRAEAYSEPQYAAMLLGAVKWALRREGSECEVASATDASAP